MSIGFSVDFTAHISYHYYRNPDSWSSVARLADALRNIGWPMVQAGTSTVLSVMPLLLVNSYMVPSSSSLCSSPPILPGARVREDHPPRDLSRSPSRHPLPACSATDCLPEFPEEDSSEQLARGRPDGHLSREVKGRPLDLRISKAEQEYLNGARDRVLDINYKRCHTRTMPFSTGGA